MLKYLVQNVSKVDSYYVSHCESRMTTFYGPHLCSIRAHHTFSKVSYCYSAYFIIDGDYGDIYFTHLNLDDD